MEVLEPLAPLSELLKRLDWELDDAEREHAEAALETASNLVRAYGRSNWGTMEDGTYVPVPVTASTIAIAAARRYMVNSDGYTVSRAGDETVGWDELGDKAGSVYLTDEEKRLIRALVSPPSPVGVQTYTWGQTMRRRRRVSELGVDDIAGYVPVDGGRPFPYYQGGGPW